LGGGGFFFFFFCALYVLNVISVTNGPMLKKYCGPHDCTAQAASIEGVILRKLVRVVRSPLWCGGG